MIDAIPGIHMLQWIGIAVCVTQSAMFSGLNLAIFSISRLRLEVAAANGNQDAVRVLGKKWVVIADQSRHPRMVLDAHHFLRDTLFGAEPVAPEGYWHRPIVVTDPRTRLGEVIGRLRVKPEHGGDDVIDDDLILVWGEHKRVITGADLLGRLLRGIAIQDGPSGR